MQALIEAARAVRANAHAPYSKYQVGAALLTAEGSIFTGCNVENASYGATLCAERSAIAKMVAAGERHPVACAVVTGPARPKGSGSNETDRGGSPCGICRQVLAEFATDLPIAIVADRGGRRDTTLSALLPDAFSLLTAKRPKK
jgi:cytidine deaminase